jgi:hypothetical protein
MVEALLFAGAQPKRKRLYLDMAEHRGDLSAFAPPLRQAADSFLRRRCFDGKQSGMTPT